MTQRLILIFVLLLLPGCAKKAVPVVALGRPDSGSRAIPADADRVLIKRASIRLKAEDPEAVGIAATKIASDLEGYTEESEVSKDRGLRLTLRIPVARLDQALEQLSRLGKVKDRSVSSEDVTERAVDLEARLNNLILARDRLKKHFQETKDLKEVLEIERELARLQGEIDSLEGQLKHLRSRVALATVTLYAARGTVLGPLGYLRWGISKLFVIR